MGDRGRARYETRTRPLSSAREQPLGTTLEVSIPRHHQGEVRPPVSRSEVASWLRLTTCRSAVGAERMHERTTAARSRGHCPRRRGTCRRSHGRRRRPSAATAGWTGRRTHLVLLQDPITCADGPAPIPSPPPWLFEELAPNTKDQPAATRPSHEPRSRRHDRDGRRCRPRRANRAATSRWPPPAHNSVAICPTRILHSWINLRHSNVGDAFRNHSRAISRVCDGASRWITR
jgi:hypothetical protein